ncbi:ERCC4 domain-containing protein [Ornithinibacter aureus]|uniref:ERCC4 domain-containing protein n=1 Tax=Ornithinibacter aureus TaxID=622664 RepID=UPI001356D10B|nr:ERCC4 domain-containing protein [Ornithinibacter aureus]
MPDPLLIARNPDPASSLPFLVRIPLGEGIVLRTKETWPRTSKVYCYRHDEPWSDDAEIVDEVPLRSVTRRGAAIEIVADRTRESRSQFVLTRARGREMIFWQSPRVAKAARPNVALPTARAAGVADLEIVVDTRERYAWKFTHQQATTRKHALPVGDYGAFVDDALVAVVERKSLADLAGALTSGRLAYRLSALAETPRAALVVEDRYSSVFKLEHVRHSLVADQLGECQVRWPSVPIIFAETRALAEEWTFRFLGAAVAEHTMGEQARRVLPDGSDG